MTDWAGGGQARPYVPGASVQRMPVDTPPDPAPGTLKRRKTPGDPACDECRTAADGACEAHAGYFAAYDPVASLGIARRTREDAVPWSQDVHTPTVEAMTP